MIIAVGSENPTKIEPVEKVFSSLFSEIEVRGVSVASEVSNQPMTDDETYTGALNRARKALHAVHGSAFGVGIEGGLRQHSYGWFEHSIVVIIDNNGRIGTGASGGLILPTRVIERINKGETLEQAIDSIFKTEKIGRGIGMFGVMTNGYVTRSGGVEHGVAFALARFLHEDIYD